MAQRLARRAEDREVSGRFQSHPRLTFQSSSRYQLNQLGSKAASESTFKKSNTCGVSNNRLYFYFTFIWTHVLSLLPNFYSGADSSSFSIFALGCCWSYIIGCIHSVCDHPWRTLVAHSAFDLSSLSCFFYEGERTYWGSCPSKPAFIPAIIQLSCDRVVQKAL